MWAANAFLCEALRPTDGLLASSRLLGAMLHMTIATRRRRLGACCTSTCHSYSNSPCGSAYSPYCENLVKTHRTRLDLLVPRRVVRL